MDYNQDFEAAKKWYKIVKEQNNQQVIDILEELFPKLKKNEDERIKNLIYCLIRDRNDNGKLLENNGVTVKEALAWLEKQNKHAENNEDDVDADFTVYYPLKNGKGRYECIPYSFYGVLSSFSEDKDMIDFLRLCFYTEEECNEWIKQNKSADKVEPKFHEGEWIVWQNKCYKVNDNGCGYELIDQNGLSTSLEYRTVDTSAHLWNITKDAKDGDVLAVNDDNVCIFDGTVEDGIYPFSYCGITKYGFESYDRKLPFSHDRNIHPATKTQRDTLMKSMTDAGYTFNFEKKELKKIEKISQRMVSAESKEALYDKPTDEEMKELLRTEYEKGKADTIAEMKSSWSEEDERLLESTTAFIEANNTFCSWKGKSKKDILPWLKSLKGRVQPKQEWSEENKQYFNFLEKLLENLQVESTENEIKYGINSDSKYYYDIKEWLKSLKERYTWKPSSEQMDALNDVISSRDIKYDVLSELWKDLKKL